MNADDEVLDSGKIADISRVKELYRAKAQFHSEYYSELEYLRSQIYDELKSSLLERAQPFEFLNWQRAVKYKYSLAPLSAKGSLVDPGGRFNIGAIDVARFPMPRGSGENRPTGVTSKPANGAAQDVILIYPAFS